MPKAPTCPEEELVDRADFPGNDWMTRYLRRIEESQGLKISSRRAYESAWRAYLVFLAKQGLNAPQAEPHHVQAFLQCRQRTTALRYGRLFERVYAQALSDKKGVKNPFSALKSLLETQEERRPSVALALPSVAELIRRLPEPQDWQEHRDHAAVVLSVSAGLRLRELRELEVVQLVPRSNGLEVQPRGRTVRSREILLDQDSATFLQKWFDARNSLKFARPSPYVFPARSGQAIPVNTFYRRIRKLMLHLVGEGILPRFGVGVLRATFAHRYASDDRVVQAQRVLGHRRITSTLRYLRHIKPVDPKLKV